LAPEEKNWNNYFGVFHGTRLVGWEMEERFNSGMNTFKLRDANFKGGPGHYIVKVRFKGKVFTQKQFITRSHCIFTIDPKAAPPGPLESKRAGGKYPSAP